MSTRAQKDRRNKALRIGAGALAILGIGGAITTAAWTDQVWFRADADAASFNLQGSLTETGPWNEYDTEGGALEIPLDASQFGELLPGDAPLTTTVYVKNDSSVPVELTATGSTAGDLFAGEGATTTITQSIEDPTLDPAGVTPVTITLTPGQIPQTLAGKTGTYTLTVSAEVGS